MDLFPLNYNEEKRDVHPFFPAIQKSFPKNRPRTIPLPRVERSNDIIHRWSRSAFAIKRTCIWQLQPSPLPPPPVIYTVSVKLQRGEFCGLSMYLCATTAYYFHRIHRTLSQPRYPRYEARDNTVVCTALLVTGIISCRWADRYSNPNCIFRVIIRISSSSPISRWG